MPWQPFLNKISIFVQFCHFFSSLVFTMANLVKTAHCGVPEITHCPILREFRQSGANLFLNRRFQWKPLVPMWMNCMQHLILREVRQKSSDFWVSRFPWKPLSYWIVLMLMNSIVMMLYMTSCTLRPHQDAFTYDRMNQFG